MTLKVVKADAVDNVVERACAFCRATVFRARVMFEGHDKVFVCATCVLEMADIIVGGDDDDDE